MAIGNGRRHRNKVFFYDFAFARFYVNEMGEPMQRERTDDIDGSPDYFAIEPLRGYSHTRKDELFSFGVSLLHLNNAELPWLKRTKGVRDIFKLMNIVLAEWEQHGIEVSEGKTLN